MAILAPALVRLRSGFNRIAPDRDKASDGWIGNLAHQLYPSGHNPDETGNAERRDADNIDEVRAIDVDKDLRQPGLTMQMCVRKTLDTARDRKRLIYIIWNGTIWAASWGWTARAYTGSNPHDKHAHFSGHPAYDNDTAPWGIEELNMLTDAERATLNHCSTVLDELRAQVLAMSLGPSNALAYWLRSAVEGTVPGKLADGGLDWSKRIASPHALGLKQIGDHLAAAEAREVARDAATKALLERVLAAAGNPLSDEQFAQALEEMRAAAADAGAAAAERLEARLAVAAQAEADALGARPQAG